MGRCFFGLLICWLIARPYHNSTLIVIYPDHPGCCNSRKHHQQERVFTPKCWNIWKHISPWIGIDIYIYEHLWKYYEHAIKCTYYYCSKDLFQKYTWGSIICFSVSTFDPLVGRWLSAQLCLPLCWTTTNTWRWGVALLASQPAPLLTYHLSRNSGPYDQGLLFSIWFILIWFP